ncbi:MAG: HD domain-containing protein [Clostridia bacterium]|nr:HD domain-containing protein [Clostridia bacterium]
MRFLPIMYTNEDQLLGESLLGTHGRLLLKKGTLLKKETVRAIEKLGYHSVYVLEGPSDSELIKPAFLQDELKLKALKIIRDNFYQFKIIYHMRNLSKDGQKIFKLMEERDVLLGQLDVVADEILFVLSQAPSHRIERVELKSDVNYQYQHALNTAILSAILGIHRNLNHLELKSLFLGAIMKEMGNVAIPEEILLKKGKLTAIEFEILKAHTEISYQEIRNCGTINDYIQHICLQHHEKLDGTGYPNGLIDRQISHLTKIVAVADTYDALTSDRGFRPAYPPHRALKMMFAEIGKSYDQNMVMLLKSLITPFPIGTFVNLNNGYGHIIGYTQDFERPIIRHESGAQIDLSRDPSYEITGLKYKV